MSFSNEPSESELHARLNAFLRADAESEIVSDDKVRREVQQLAADARARRPDGLVGSAQQDMATQPATARWRSAAFGADQRDPMSYGALARFADRQAGRTDGRRGIPAIPSGSPEATDPHMVTTPYLMILRSHFQNLSEHESRRALSEAEPLLRDRAAVRQRLARAAEQLAAISQHLRDIPEEPAETILSRRNPLEQSAPEALVRARREREHLARRARIQSQAQEAAAAVRALQDEEARLTEMITASRQVLAIKVKQLHDHTMRRCATYLNHLVRRHRHGPALISLLNPALPNLPDWLPDPDADSEPADITLPPVSAGRGRPHQEEGPTSSWQHRSTDGARNVPDVRATQEAGYGQTARHDTPDDLGRAAVMQEVRELTFSLDGALDEGTGAALDNLIDAWTGKWIAAVETDHIDRRASITVLREHAAHRLAEAVLTARHDNERLVQAHDSHLAYSARLEAPQPGQSNSYLATGSGVARFAGTALSALAATFIETVAFRYSLALALPEQSNTLAWLTSAGAATIALAAAASIGISLANLRRERHGVAGLAAAVVAAAWAALGLSAVLVPLLGAGGHSTPFAALFSGAAYLIGGAYATFEAERTHGGGYLAYARLGRQYRQQQKKVADAEATVEQARAAMARLDAELDRENHRRQAAIVERRALGAEAANYARVLMASMMRDPAKTAITETGPDSPSATFNSAIDQTAPTSASSPDPT